MGPESQRMISELQRYVVVDPQPFAVDLDRCEGMWLATVDGDRLFDWAGYYGSKLIGHNHPGLQEPAYAARLLRAANNKVANPDFLTRECLDYYRLVHSLAPACMRDYDVEVYVVNSGAEAVENMMKYLINLHLQKHSDDDRRASRRRFVYFEQAFHGRTVFALNVTELPHDMIATRDFQGFDHGNMQAPFPAVDTDADDATNRRRSDESLAEIEAYLTARRGEVVAIVVEPIQGAGGHRLAEPDFYRRLSRLAHDHDVFLGFDEVQTAGGQTGRFFAVDHFDLPYPPQAIASAKKMGCGVVYMLHPMDDHGVLDSTWGGSLADMVRFVREMEIVCEEQLIETVPARTDRLVGNLRRIAADSGGAIRNVRGLGLYQGFTLADPAMKPHLVRAARDYEGLLLLGAGTDSVRLRPALTVTMSEIDEFGQRLSRAVRRILS